ncbi:NAD(P)H-binding protein, partial [Patulibacter sp. NPDC049589]|uniref:NAD(P)H-binding protein n=1 Tax=Patulibacter sp. NPDC049589 TaxID=3154731 RepID=UPI00343B5CA7
MSTDATYAVTGATGQLGTLVLERLVARYGPSRVVALTRSPARLRAWAERGVTVREADFDAPGGLPDALRGIDRLLVITTTHESTGRRVAQHRGVIDAAVAAGVAHLALTSMPKLAPGHPSGVYAAEYLETEELLATTTDRLGWTVLRNGPYAENLLPRLTAAVAAGRLVSNAGDGRAGYASRADYAVAAVAAMAGPALR